MTWAELKIAVANLTKSGVPDTSEVNAVIETGLELIWQEFIEQRRLDEFLRNRVDTSLATAVASKGVIKVAEQNKMVDVKEIRYASGIEEWTLANEDGRIPPALVEGKPKCFRIIGQDLTQPATGDRIYIEPWATIDSAVDKLYVTYWEYPKLLDGTITATTIDNTLSATTKFDTELVDRAAAYVLIYYKKLDQAQLLLNKYRTPPASQPQQADNANSQ